MTTPTLKINTSQETRYDFDVAINGLDANAQPEVRFVVESSSFDAVVKCEKTSSGWSVAIPPMPLTESSGFKVEVLVDGYYFVPVSGGVQLVSAPKVGLKEAFTAAAPEKPTVSATFSTPVQKTVEAKPAPKKLVESFSPTERKKVAETIKGAAHVFGRAASIFEAMAAKGEINPSSVNEVLGVVRKSMASVEVKIYV